MENKNGIDSVTILCILAIILLVVIMVLPPLLRVIVEDEEETVAPEVKASLTVDSINSLGVNGIVDCSKDNQNITFSYENHIISLVKDVTTYTRPSSDIVDDCNNKSTNYKEVNGINVLCEYNQGKFVSSYSYNYNTLEDDSELEVKKNSNIKDVLKDYINNGYTCYLK